MSDFTSVYWWLDCQVFVHTVATSVTAMPLTHWRCWWCEDWRVTFTWRLEELLSLGFSWAWACQRCYHMTFCGDRKVTFLLRLEELLSLEFSQVKACQKCYHIGGWRVTFTWRLEVSSSWVFQSMSMSKILPHVEIGVTFSWVSQHECLEDVAICGSGRVTSSWVSPRTSVLKVLPYVKVGVLFSLGD